MEKSAEQIHKMIESAANMDPGDAMKMTQAALNAANALCSLGALEDIRGVAKQQGRGNS